MKVAGKSQWTMMVSLKWTYCVSFTETSGYRSQCELCSHVNNSFVTSRRLFSVAKERNVALSASSRPF